MIIRTVKAVQTLVLFTCVLTAGAFSQPLYDSLKTDFSNLPLGKRLTNPLFWQHGESDSILKMYVDRMIDAGCGTFIIESRPHPDWLGPAWYADCKVILDYAKTKGMGGYIYDERWWPSFDIAGRVPAEHRARELKCAIYPNSAAGTNLALSGTATASSIYGAGNEASLANDGNPATRWNSASGQFNDQWLEIAWSSAKIFNTVILKEGIPGRIQSFHIQHWNGTAWADDVTGTTVGDSKTLTFTEVTSARVRVYVNTATSDPTFWEFEVYNDPGTGTVITGPVLYSGTGFSGSNYIKTIAGKVVNGLIDGSSLIDLASNINTSGNLSWNAPEGSWKIFNFTWGYQGSQLLDLTTQSAADWFVNNVVKPHYDNTGATNILGFFYDEPEYHGTWGLDMEKDSPDWKQIMVGRFTALGGEDQGKATYAYWETLGERLGRVGYGTYARYVRSRGGKLIGHDNEDDRVGCHPLDHGMGMINLMEQQKYQDIPGMDMVYNQIETRKKSYWLNQLPKLVSSTSITNNLPGHYAMCEIFGADGWGQTWQSRKWIADFHQVHGINVMIPHAFNPKGDMTNPDGDCPPFYYYTGDEANWPNYKAWCERQNRLGYMLSGNDSGSSSIAPVAVLWPGYSKYADSTWNDNCYPYNLQSALDRVHYDHQLLTCNRFESTAVLNSTTKQIELYKSRYRILVLPPVQHIQYATLAKAKQFYDNGGIVIGWQRVPTRSARFGNSDSDIQNLSAALWNSLAPTAGTTPINTNGNGGKTYFIAAIDEATITTNLRGILGNSGSNSDFKVISGTFDDWTGYCHRKKNGMDVFMVWNGTASAASITARFQASGDPELWNPTTKTVTSLTSTKVSSTEVDIALTIPAEESYLVVFKPSAVATDPQNQKICNASLTLKCIPDLVSRPVSIGYTVNTRQHVALSVFTAAGRKAATIFDGDRVPGRYTASFNPDRFSNGTYIVTLASNAGVIKKKLIVMKR